MKKHTQIQTFRYFRDCIQNELEVSDRDVPMDESMADSLNNLEIDVRNLSRTWLNHWFNGQELDVPALRLQVGEMLGNLDWLTEALGTGLEDCAADAVNDLIARKKKREEAQRINDSILNFGQAVGCSSEALARAMGVAGKRLDDAITGWKDMFPDPMQKVLFGWDLAQPGQDYTIKANYKLPNGYRNILEDLGFAGSKATKQGVTLRQSVEICDRLDKALASTKPVDVKQLAADMLYVGYSKSEMHQQVLYLASLYGTIHDKDLFPKGLDLGQGIGQEPTNPEPPPLKVDLESFSLRSWTMDGCVIMPGTTSVPFSEVRRVSLFGRGKTVNMSGEAFSRFRPRLNDRIEIVAGGHTYTHTFDKKSRERMNFLVDLKRFRAFQIAKAEDGKYEPWSWDLIPTCPCPVPDQDVAQATPNAFSCFAWSKNGKLPVWNEVLIPFWDIKSISQNQTYRTPPLLPGDTSVRRELGPTVKVQIETVDGDTYSAELIKGRKGLKIFQETLMAFGQHKVDQVNEESAEPVERCPVPNQDVFMPGTHLETPYEEIRGFQFKRDPDNTEHIVGVVETTQGDKRMSSHALGRAINRNPFARKFSNERDMYYAWCREQAQ